ncbi:PREDICTED: uncharacterized protein LOC106111068 [Papilio polytes]|uniref:uncharacterized protein LOC106111068 n=1 Tax=Papilio polytes TaxID=76194 RepID=UPI0006760941|nr:PREDICTED: uncharacterized protein LOC106111068 [Papilio polytes]
MTSVLKKSRGTKGKSESMQEDLPSRWGNVSRGHRSEDVGKLIRYIDDNIIGKGNSFCGPFGRRKVVYCDYNGSGRALQWIEEYIVRDVLPTHATRCTALSYTSGQSDIYRSESKAIIGAAIGASCDDVIVLGASLPRLLRALRPQRVALFVSARETERQLAPWREFDAEIIKVAESKDGFIDLNNLELKLQENTGTGKRMIGFFPAASVAPTSNVDMNPTFLGVEEGMVRKDALFFNCEKFVGGVQGPYVAVVKKDVFKNSPVYSDDVEVLSERIEEYRCAEAVRAALVMQLRDSVGLQNILEKQDNITRQVLSHIKNIPELILLGTESPTVKRLPIFSLMVKHPRGTFLHHNFVCAILNDVFGIQARGGLTSNLNYGADVLGIDDQLLKEYEKLLDVEAQKEVARVRKLSDAKAPDVPIHNEHLRPGFCRVSLPYFMSDTELAFVLEALKMVATEGWKILPQYVVNTETGQWRHHTCSVLRDRKSLYSLRYNDGQMTAHERRVSGPGIFPQTYTECLQTARNLFNRARKLAMKCSTIEPEVSFNPRIDYLRWFMLPKEAHDLLLGRSANVKHIVPFDPSGYTGARKSLNFSRSSVTSSPIFGASSRHFSLSAIDDCQIFRLKQKQKFYSRESSLKETTKEQAVTVANPVKFALGESVSPLRIVPQSAKPMLGRSRCYSLGSDSPPVQLSAETKMNLGLKETSPSSEQKTNGFCNCGSQTDLQSLDDPMISPGKAYPYSAQSSTSISDCSQTGRISPTTSITSHTSEDIQAYVKEMTRELATEIKSEIRGVISKVDDILENSDSLDQSNVSLNSTSSQSEKNSVSVIDVAEYLMGMSREMASEVKHEIREMVNQVDEMISPEYSSCTRRSSPPQTGRRRIGSGPELGLDLNKSTQCLRKCTTSPVLPCHVDEDESFVNSPNLQSPKSAQGTPSHEATGPNNISFNSSETSTPDTIIQVVTTSQNSPVLPKSSSSNKLSDDEVCADVACRHCCSKKICCQNPSVSSQDSGINMTFTESDAYLEFVKWRTSSDPTTNKLKKLQGRLRICKHEKSEVPDIIEGVPVCSNNSRADKSDSASGRVAFQISDDAETQNVTSSDWKRSSRCSNASSSCSERSSRSSGYGTDQHRAIQEYKMVREGDKVLVCLSGRRDSVALLHAMHHYQYYARAKGQHFSIGALFVHEPQSEVDPLHLMAYCRTLGVKFIYEDKLDDEESIAGSSKSELHRWASGAVRRRAYVAAAAHGYGVAALAHCLDSAAAAFLASALHAARLATTKAHYTLRDHDLRIIRPFIYVRARALEAFACARALPDFTAPAAHDTDNNSKSPEESCSCSQRAPLSAARALLAAHEREHPQLFSSLKTALQPLIAARNMDRESSERRHRKKSVIQMRNGAPVVDSDDGSEEEPVT